LDAANRKSYPGSGTTWLDMSGNANNGTLVNGPTFSSVNNGILTFNGSNQYISFNAITTPSLGLTSSNGATISGWLNLNISSQYKGVIGIFSAPNSEAFGWDLMNSNFIRIWKTSTGILTTISTTPYSNIWIHYVLVSNSTNVIFYINGSQAYTTSAVGNIVDNGTLQFGNWDGNPKGNVSNLQIYNRALSAAEISQNYNATKSRFGL
jgi:hypothetical protein